LLQNIHRPPEEYAIGLLYFYWVLHIRSPGFAYQGEDQMQTTINRNEVLNGTATSEGLAILDRAEAAIKDGRVPEALDAIFNSLQNARSTMTDEEWQRYALYIREDHEIAELVKQDPMTRRALDKPRGYAGDAVMMDYLYGIHSSIEAEQDASPLGRDSFRYIQERPAGKAVRYRREHIAELIDGMAARGGKPHVLAIASGHLREAELCRALSQGSMGRFVALDADEASLKEVTANYGCKGIEAVHGSVRHILARKVKLGNFDLVYAAGLYDYLTDNIARVLTVRMFEMTRPGGQMMIANFAPQVRDRGYMEAFMDWHLIYRTEEEMGTLMEDIDPEEVESCQVYSDPDGSVVYLMVHKRQSVN
jgi:extracellular factor (EF) 3-hydroxypalmitic acid methyl ester biosynthesis protein